MSIEERARTILELRGRGWSYQRIAKQIGMSKNAVIATIKRYTEPRPRGVGEVDNLVVPPEKW